MSQAEATSSVTEGYEGPLTVLFTDVAGSTGLRSALGDAGFQELLRSHQEVVRREVARHAGREIKALGDGFMLAFTSARRAVECAVAIQRATAASSRGGDGFGIRMGLNTGEVLIERGDLYGEAVDAASRIVDRARRGEVLAAGVVRELAGRLPGIGFKDRGRVRLKGFPEKRHLFEIVWRPQEEGAAPERTPFIGREEERAELLRVLDDALSGRGGLVFIGGEPGVGKTRLADEILAEGTRRGMSTLTGRCYEREGAPPYVPFVEVLEAAARGAVRSEALREALGDVAGEIARIVPELHRHFRDLPPPLELPPEQERRYLFNSVTQFVDRAAAIRPQLILLDDLHWSDEPTLLLLSHLAQRLHEHRVLILGTYRDVELEVGRPLANVLEELLRKRLARRVTLRRLSQDAVAKMLAALAHRPAPDALVKSIYEETEGNPFFVEEVFKYLREEGKLFDSGGDFRPDLSIDELDVPESIRLVIGRRLHRLSENAVRALTAAAVIGRAFEYELLEAVGQLEPDALLDAIQESESAHIVSSSPHDDRMFFAHELIRATLLAQMAAPLRRRLHLRVAEAMENIYDDRLDEVAADVAYHLQEAGAAASAGKAAEFLRRAGWHSIRVAGFEEAERAFSDAASLATENEETEADILYGLGVAQRSLGLVDDALETWRKALAFYERLEEGERFGKVSFDIAEHLGWLSRWPEALEFCARGLAREDIDDESRARLLGLSAILVANSGEHDQAIALFEEAKQLADKVGDPLLAAYGDLARALIHHAFVEFEDAAELGLSAGPLVKESGRLWDYTSFMGFFQFALFFLGRWDEARTLGDELEALALKLGHDPALVLARRSRPLPVFLEGDIDGIEDFARRDLDRTEEIGPLLSSQAQLWLALVRFWRGDWDEAEDYAIAALERDAPGIWSQPPWAFLALLRAYVGKREEALDMLGQQIAILPAAGQSYHWGTVTIAQCAVEAFYVLGERDRAAELYPVLLEVKDKMIGRVMDIRFSETLCGIAAGCAERWDEAESHFEDALAKQKVHPMAVESYDSRYFYARMLLERGNDRDEARARSLAQEALDGYRRLEMPRHEAMARALL